MSIMLMGKKADGVLELFFLIWNHDYTLPARKSCVIFHSTSEIFLQWFERTLSLQKMSRLEILLGV